MENTSHKLSHNHTNHYGPSRNYVVARGAGGEGVYSQNDKHKPQLVKKATREERGQKY